MPIDQQQTDEMYAENVLTDKIRDGVKPNKVDIKLNNKARNSLVLADVTWRLGRYMNEKGYAGLTSGNAEDLTSKARELLGAKKGKTIDDATISNLILNGPSAYNDPNAVITWNGGTFQWQNKDIAEENGVPYVYTVKQAISAIAQQNGISYAQAAANIAPNGYHKNFREYKRNFDVIDQAKNKLLGVVGLDRLGEVFDDPQLESKDGAKLRAVAPAIAEMAVGEAVPGFIMGRGFHAAKTGKNISKGWDTANKVAKGALAGGLGGAASPLAGYAADKAAGGWQGDREAPSIGQYAASFGIGAGLGAGAGALQPLRKDDAARRLLYKNAKGNADVAEELYPHGFGDVRKGLVDAAEGQVPASDYSYAPMNDPYFQGEKVGTQAMPKKVGRFVEASDGADDNLVGQWRDLKKNELGGEDVNSGSSGMKIKGGKPSPAEYDQYKEQKAAYNDANSRLRKANEQLGKYAELTSTPNKMPTFTNSLEDLDRKIAIAEANGDSKAYARYTLERAKLLDRGTNGVNAAVAKNMDIASKNRNNAVNADLWRNRANEAQAELDALGVPMVPKAAPQEATLVAPDVKVAHNWIDEYNHLHPENQIHGDKYIKSTQDLLKQSQDPASQTSRVVDNQWEGSLEQFNKNRGQYKFTPNDDTNDNCMRNDVWKDPVWKGSPEKTDAFNAARKETSTRKKETQGANGGDNGYVGGKDFKQKREAMQGNHGTFRKQIAPRLPLVIPVKHGADMFNEYNLDDWRIPTKH